MTKEEVKLALSEGKKITHDYFQAGEYVYLECVNPNTRPIKYECVFEDGVRQSEEEFWALRQDECWNKGWYIFEN